MSEPIDQIREIRNMMERSTKFLSLSGLSGVSAGICALLGAWHVYSVVGELTVEQTDQKVARLLIQDGVIVLLAALLCALFFTLRKAKQKGIAMWGPASKALLRSLAVPLVVGGLFVLGLIDHELYWMFFPATLIFYGLALVSGSKHTVNDTYVLGLAQVVLGLAAFFSPGLGLLFWAIGFGGLHIIYGVVMYFKYDK